MTNKSDPVLIDRNPGRSAQPYGIARELGTPIELVHEPSVGVVGNKGDSQCYLGVQRKSSVCDALLARLGTGEGQMRMRLVQPEFTVASDGRQRYWEMPSLIGRG